MAYAVRLTLTLVLLCHSAQALECVDWFKPAATKEELEKRPRWLDVFRFHGKKDFSAANHMLLTQREGGGEKGPYVLDISGVASQGGGYSLSNRNWKGLYQSGMTQTAPNPNYPSPYELGGTQKKLQSLHQQNQEFPLGIMEGDAYIDPATVQKLKEESETLDPSQVTFIEVREERLETELILEYGALPPHAKPEPHRNGWNRYRSYFDGYSGPGDVPYILEVGAVRLVSGQPKRQSLPLPFETPNLINKVDRTKYPVVFEIGRAAQIKGGAFQEALRAAAYFAAHEVATLGYRLEDAHVFVDSRNEAHNRLYAKVYKMQEFSGYEGESEHRAFTIPLKMMLEYFKLTEFGGNFKDLSISTDQKAGLGPWEARNKISLWLEALLVNPEQPTRVLEVRDFSKLVDLYMNQVGAPSRHRWEPPVEMRDYIYEWASKAKMPQYDHYIRIDHPGIKANEYEAWRFENLRQFLNKHNAVEVLDVTLDLQAILNQSIQSSCKDALVATYRNMVERLRAEGCKDPEAEIQNRKVKFAYSTFDVGSANSARALQPLDRYWVIRDPITVSHMGSFFNSGYEEQVISAVHFESFVFSVEQIQAWAAEPGASSSGWKLSLENQNRLLERSDFLAP